MVNLLILVIFAILSPWMIRIIYNDYIRSIPATSMPLPSYFILMIVPILLDLTNFLIYNVPMMPNLTVYLNVSFTVGFLLRSGLACLTLMIIGTGFWIHQVMKICFLVLLPILDIIKFSLKLQNPIIRSLVDQ